MPEPGLAVFATAYRAGLPFLADFLGGLARQTDPGFRLLLALDDVTPEEVTPYLGAGGPELAARTTLCRGTAGADQVMLRVDVLRRILPDFTGVILLDSDDVPLADRVAAARAQLTAADVAACAMQLTDAAGRDLPGVFTTEVTDWPALLAGSNVIGFGNSAYRSAVLLDCLEFAPRSPNAPPGARLLDWLVAAIALGRGARLAFDPTPRVRYRLHGASLAGVTRPFSEAQLQRAAELVASHHAYLLAPDARRALTPDLLELVGAAAADLERLRARVVAVPAARSRYVTALNATPRIYRWWEWLSDRRLLTT